MNCSRKCLISILMAVFLVPFFCNVKAVYGADPVKSPSGRYMPFGSGGFKPVAASVKAEKPSASVKPEKISAPVKPAANADPSEWDAYFDSCIEYLKSIKDPSELAKAADAIAKDMFEATGEQKDPSAVSQERLLGALERFRELIKVAARSDEQISASRTQLAIYSEISASIKNLAETNKQFLENKNVTDAIYSLFETVSGIKDESVRREVTAISLGLAAFLRANGFGEIADRIESVIKK